MKIKVTAEDIKRGKRQDCWRDPVARAARRATSKSAWVGYFTMGLDGRKARKLPKKVASFVSRFDAGKPVKPFSFEIDL